MRLGDAASNRTRGGTQVRLECTRRRFGDSTRSSPVLRALFIHGRGRGIPSRAPSPELLKRDSMPRWWRSSACGIRKHRGGTYLLALLLLCLPRYAVHPRDHPSALGADEHGVSHVRTSPSLADRIRVPAWSRSRQFLRYAATVHSMTASSSMFTVW
ncbi:hypothetical protein DFH09DRAFT_170692 [Mycena vulgaris]|nr:hypothetical protein DFH09DRAFT_170692 [Mycena vulgaris]